MLRHKIITRSLVWEVLFALAVLLLIAWLRR
jgi:hypothetical protein